MPMLTYDRAAGALFGLAAGDALGAPTENLTRAEIAARWGWVDDFCEGEAVGTDDTEYAVFTARLVIEHGAALTAGNVAAAWRRDLLTQGSEFLTGGFSESGALANMKRLLEPPACGAFHHEPFSDGAAMRAAPIGIFCAGDPAEAARLAREDAQVSHARDGIYCAQAIAAGVATAVAGDDWRAVCNAALSVLPEDCWTTRLITRALAIAAQDRPKQAMVDALVEGLVCAAYPWSDIGPEATALAFGAFAAARGDYVGSVATGINVGRDADTIAAMAGALAGGLNGLPAIPLSWAASVRTVRGRCLAVTRDADLADLAEQLVLAARTPAP
jgi:ADP-ribosylglycohydrolase